MPETFTKLFGSILASTVWQEPDATRLTWITMLAMADKDGLVSASVPGLAHMARVSVPQCEDALRTFLAPDPYSRTPDHDGRRIEADAGGWRLLNHAMYRAIRDTDDRREYQRQWDRDNRKRNPTKSDTELSESDKSDPILTKPTNTDTEAYTEAEAKKSFGASSDDDKRRTTNGSRLADDWTLPYVWKAWAIGERPDVDADREGRCFADYWHGVAGAKGRKADWEATWRNWIRRAQARGGGSGRNGSAPREPQQLPDLKS